jgi:hypothetical protein
MYKIIVFALGMTLMGLAQAQATPHSRAAASAGNTQQGVNSSVQTSNSAHAPAQGNTANVPAANAANGTGHTQCLRNVPGQNNSGIKCFQRPTRAVQR